MKKKSKLLAILIGLGLTFTLTACGDFHFGSTGRSNVPPTTETSENEDSISDSLDDDEQEEELDEGEDITDDVPTDEGDGTTNPDDGGDGDGDGDDGDDGDGNDGGNTEPDDEP